MLDMLAWSHFLLAFLTVAFIVEAAPVDTGKPTLLKDSEVSALKPYTHYAKISHCQPASTKAWNCDDCKFNPEFKPVASGGDGDTVQFWYVGYDPRLKTIIVGYQGTDPSKLMPVVTDLEMNHVKLDSSMFPGIDKHIKVHRGFRKAQELSATDVLNAVKIAMFEHSAHSVTIIGHSLGGAIALLTSVYLPLHLPPQTVFKTVTYGMPRVGNLKFAEYVDAHCDLTRIDNKNDPVPIVPGRFLGYHHPVGEVHIMNSDKWIRCPGRENEDPQCTLAYVPNVKKGTEARHDGPYDGIELKC